MTVNDCFNLGYISKRIGNKGELAFVLDVDDPARYKKLQSVFLQLNGTLVPFFIQTLQLRGNTAVVALEGVDSIDRAEELTGTSLYLPLNMLPPMKGKKFYFHEMPGFTVIDKVFGEVGVIEKVLDFPQQAIFQVKRGEQEILIPAREEFIIKIDREARKIELQAPEGLIDIYVGGNQENDEVD
ncbi:MAG: ribosome maturation factor RimM [Bacteroidia bacterium]|jgi:16S rRNA processing protein RimM